MRRRIAMATMSALLGASLVGAVGGSSATAAALTGPDCFAAHKQAGPLTSLAEARVCAPTATAYTSMPSLVTGQTAIIHSGKFYSVVYASASTQLATPAASGGGCGAYWRNFSKQNWWFGNAAGAYQPYGYSYFRYPYGPFGCNWYANMTANNFYFSWCFCAGWGHTEGTYDSNWAHNHGYGYWATAWVNGYFLTPFPVMYGFTCRGALSPDGGLSYPGCFMG